MVRESRGIDSVVRASFELTSEAQLSYCHYCCVLGEYCKPAVLQSEPLCRLGCSSECPSLQPCPSVWGSSSLHCEELPSLMSSGFLSPWHWQLPHPEWAAPLSQLPVVGFKTQTRCCLSWNLNKIIQYLVLGASHQASCFRFLGFSILILRN